MGTDKDPKTWKLSPSPLDPEGRFPPLLFRILSYATLLMLLALFPAAFLFGDEPREGPFRVTFIIFVAVAGACVVTVLFCTGTLHARRRRAKGP